MPPIPQVLLPRAGSATSSQSANASASRSTSTGLSHSTSSSSSRSASSDSSRSTSGSSSHSTSASLSSPSASINLSQSASSSLSIPSASASAFLAQGTSSNSLDAVNPTHIPPWVGYLVWGILACAFLVLMYFGYKFTARRSAARKSPSRGPRPFKLKPNEKRCLSTAPPRPPPAYTAAVNNAAPGAEDDLFKTPRTDTTPLNDVTASSGPESYGVAEIGGLYTEEPASGCSGPRKAGDGCSSLASRRSYRVALRYSHCDRGRRSVDLFRMSEPKLIESWRVQWLLPWNVVLYDPVDEEISEEEGEGSGED
ncbi:hypothetical protein C8F04DRAFT_1196973 [Mycena alexandri]|uniref:Uncharacterized protein n=1 Tax=Mycena alexandri TaxID=1745969 RepID=A0AAD6S447_9AGAR|nr:hypothetical protein C8F04DRAFT_1196973 [Mycena alexandri]